MALTKQKLLHKRSSVEGRILAPSALTYGELAINFASGANKSFLEIKKSDDTTALYFEHPYGIAAVDVSGTSAGYYSGTISGITEYYDGLTIKVRLKSDYNSSWNTLNINGLGYKMIWYQYDSRMTSHFGMNHEILLTYRSDAGSFQATSTARGLVSGTTYKDGWVALTALNTYTKQEIDDAHFVIAEAINSLNDNKQDKLVSGVNIKTVGGQSLLGGGDISISGITVETANSANTLTHTLTMKQNSTTIGTWNGSDNKTLTFSDSATTYDGHYTPSNNAIATTSGARITGITKDGKGHIISIATAATDNTDTATTETGHYTPSTTASTEGSTGAGNFIKTITLDSKKHVLAITSGTALTSYTEASVAISNSGQTNNSPQSVVYGAVTGGTKGHSITLQRTNKVYSASTADSARTAYSASTALSASTAGKLAGTLNIYENGTLLTTYDGSSTLSALTTNTNPSVTAGTVGTGVVTGITASGTSNHAIVGIKTTLVKVASATTADTAVALGYHPNATTNSYRNVWFSYEGQDGKLVVDTAFQYNPGKNSLKVSAITTNGTNQVLVPAKDGTIALLSDIDGALAGSVNYKGATATLPSSSTTGDMWITTAQIALTAAQSATGAAQTAETGDFLIARESGKWDVVQKNIDGAVTTTATTLTDGNVIVGKGNRTIGASSYTIAKSVPSTALFTDSATTYTGHYTPSSDSTGTTSGARITGITKDGKGHIISIATAATDNTDTATTETGHYSPTGKTNSVGVATAGSFLKQVFYDSKGHVTSATTGTALTSFTETQLSYNSGTSVSTAASSVMTGLTVSNHAITYGKTNKIFSATTADSARTVISTFKVSSAATATNLQHPLHIYQNGTRIATYSGGTIISALTTDTDTKVTAVGNHYTATTATKTGGTTTETAASAVKGITYDAAGHIVSITTGSVLTSAADTATTYAGHYTPSSDSTGTTSGTRITGITKDGKGHIISIATAATDNTDTATTETGHYSPTGKTNSVGVATSGSFLKQVFYDSKGHVTSATTGTALTSQASVTAGTVGTGVVTGLTASGTSNHAVVGLKTTSVLVDSATTAYNMFGETGTVNQYRNVWFSDSVTETKRNNDTQFQYNPDKNALKVSAITTNGTNLINIPAKDGDLALTTDIDDVEFVFATVVNDLNYNKQEKLVSGQNIKTVGGQSILGTGDISISGVTVEIVNSAQTLTHTITLKQNTTTVGTWNGSDNKTVTFSDSATTYTGHYIPTTANTTASTTGAVITGITYDSKGHIITIDTGSSPDDGSQMTVSVATTSASITLDTSASRTYKIYSGNTTSITLNGTVQNEGYEHYALFKNTGSGSMTITPKAGWISTDSTFSVDAGGYIELSYICAGGLLIITGSKKMSAV